METKICNKCGEEKSLTEFHKDKITKDGYRYICKKCVKNHTELYYSNPINKEKSLIQNRIYSKNRSSEQKEKNKIRAREYRNNPINKIKIKEYYNRPDVKEKAIIRAREYYKNNREKRNINFKTKLNTDMLFKLKNNVRGLIYKSLKNKGYTKNSRTYEILGCSYEEFKSYIESKFEHWMTWDNYGLYNGELNYGWDIDHIIPQSSATTEEEIIQLNHYTNLQPLCSKTNRDIKRNNIVNIPDKTYYLN